MNKYLTRMTFLLTGLMIAGASDASPQTKKQDRETIYVMIDYDYAALELSVSGVVRVAVVSRETLAPRDIQLIAKGVSKDFIHSEYVLLYEPIAQTDPYLERSQEWLKWNNINSKPLTREIIRTTSRSNC